MGAWKRYAARPVSQTPSEPASPRALARARARGDLPYSAELPLALALLALVGLGVGPATALVGSLRHLAIAAWSGQLAFPAVWGALRGLLGSLFLLLCVPALAALFGVLAQRAPTLRFFVATGAGSTRNEQRGRPSRGRVAHNLLAALKGLVLAASLGLLLYDSLAGFLESYARSSSQLLAITLRVVPAFLLRAAWACLVLGGVELGAQHVERLRRLRMTRQQVQDEQRELVADPRLLSERRARATDVPVRVSPQLRAATVAQLSAAALLITGRNSVVALQYQPEVGVPTLLLSAEGALAVELLQRAYTLELPIASDELLTLALFHLPARSSIPKEQHGRVAQLMVAHGVPAAREAS
jgi:flagellar biosynthetic protein FlhB